MQKRLEANLPVTDVDRDVTDAGVNWSAIRRKTLQILFNSTTVIPFKWRGSYMCFFCGSEIASPAELRTHTKAHGSCSTDDVSLQAVRSPVTEVKVDISDISCELCSKQFPNLDRIIRHLIHKHSMDYNEDATVGIAPYRLVDLKCLSCEDQFNSFKKLVRHTNVAHPTNCFICYKCSQTFNKQRDMIAHINNYHRVSGYKCDECNEEFKTNVKLRTHKDYNHSRCDFCFKKFPNLAKKSEHVKETHLTSGTLECSFCSKVLHTKTAYINHTSKCIVGKQKKKLHEESNGEVYVKRITHVKKLRNNLSCLLNMSTVIPFKYFMGKFRCFYCSKDFVECDALKEHTVRDHPTCNAKDKSLKLKGRTKLDLKLDVSSLACKVCYEIMPDLDFTIDHLISKHKASYDKEAILKITSFKLIRDNFQCPFCPENSDIFRYFGNLLKHINADHSNNNLLCVYCGQAFRSDPNLRAHIARKHREGGYKCKDCDAEFSTNLALNAHMAKIHGTKKFKCSKCHEIFISAYMRQKHLIAAHDLGFKCKFCDKVFTRNSFMRDHIRRTHLKEKTVECSVCGTKFFDNFMLRMHMVKHIGDRNFHCDVCGKKFLWKKNLTGHMASHRKNSSQV